MIGGETLNIDTSMDSEVCEVRPITSIGQTTSKLLWVALL
jgi:hypothetical protein